MGYQKWSYELLHGFCMDAFEKFGFTEAEANIIQDVLLTADLYGIESHGMQRMVRYHKCIEKGMIHVDAKPEVVFETPVSAVVDGHDGMGQLIGHFAMELAIEKAKKSGVGIVLLAQRAPAHLSNVRYGRMLTGQKLFPMSLPIPATMV